MKLQEYDNYKKEGNDRKKIIIISSVIAVVFIAAIVLIGAGNKKGKSGGPGGFGGGFPGGPGGFGGSGGGQATAVSVRTMTAEIQDLQDFVTTNGEIETQVSLDVFPSIGGTVVQMNVSLGSYVNKGDVIGYVDPSEPGSYFAKSPVYAPMSGSILTSPVKVGQKVNVSTVVTRVGDINNLQITAKIPERYVSDLAIGQKAEIILQAYPDMKFQAKVVKISPVVDSASRTKDIILNFDKKYSQVNAGMFAKVKLYTKVYSGSILMDQDSLVTNSDKYYAYVVKEDDTVSKREITLGKNVDGKYQILSGVEPGETVVTEGMLTLYEGAAIKDVDKVSLDAPGAPEGKPGDFPAKGGPNESK